MHISVHNWVQRNGATKARYRCTKSSTTFCTGCTRAANENVCQLALNRTTQKKKEISHDAVYYHFRKWSRDGSFENLWKASIMAIESDLNLSELNLDGSRIIAKNGAEAVAYQGHKRTKTSNILPITDKEGYILVSTPLIAGNHNDTF